MRILGIDLGKTSVKAVELDTAFGRYELHEYHERKLDNGVDPIEAVRDLIHSLPKAADRIVVAIRSGQTTFRNLQLPTRDKKAIQASVAFELDDELPFPIEDAVYDYQILSQASSLSNVHVASTLGRYVSGVVETWIGTGVDPDVITTEAWAYRSLLSRIVDLPAAAAGQESPRPTLLLQLGHDRSTLYVHHKGVPIIAREIKWGGADLTLAICQKYSIPIEQAESAKLDHGFVLPESQRSQATSEQVEFSNTLLGPLATLFREIRQADLTCKSLIQENIGRIYLCGGTSLLPGLSKRLAEELRLPVQSLQALSSLSHAGVRYSEETDARFALATALAMTQVGGRGSGLNLRRGEFAKQGARSDVGWKQLKGPMLAIGSIATCVLLSFVVQTSIYNSRLKDTNSQLEKSIKTFFGGLPPSALRNYMNSTSTLKKQINGELTKHRELSKLMTPNPKSPLEFLRELSATTPRDVVIDVTQFQIGAAAANGPYKPEEDSQASLTVLVSNPQMAEKFAGLLSGKIAGMQRSKMEEVPGADGGPKRWKITFSGKPNEEAYGK